MGFFSKNVLIDCYILLPEALNAYNLFNFYFYINRYV